ncbi:hypothetical protein ACLOJK_000218 [Asimina triloba]
MSYNVGLTNRLRGCWCPGGPSCTSVRRFARAPPSAGTAMAQKGVWLRLDVLGRRDLGSFIFQYTGDAVDETIRIEDNDHPVESDGDEYVFKPTSPEEVSFKWNYKPNMVGNAVDRAAIREKPMALPSESLKLAISARSRGNVARFMNHGCRPSVFWQQVAYNYLSDCNLHIMFYALKHIPSLRELTYDYGMRRGTASGGEEGHQHHRKIKKCSCGSPQCRLPRFLRLASPALLSLYTACGTPPP